MHRSRKRRSHHGSGHEAEPEVQSLPQVPDAPRWVMILGTVLALLPAFVGTGNTGWEQGITALAAGLLLVLAPPRHGISLTLTLLFAGVFLLACLPLLPLPWGGRPEWWSALEKDFGLSLGRAWTAQPWVTLESISRFFVSVAWLMWWLCRAPDYASQRLIMRVMGGGVALLAVLALTFRMLGWEPALWDNPLAPQFGPLANRNVFAGLVSLGMIASLAAAYDLHRRQNKAWMIYAVAMVPLLGAVLVNRSRAGLIIFVLTVILWLMTSTFRQGMMQRLSIAGSIILVVTTALMIFGRQLMERFVVEQETVSGVIANDGRLPVFREALMMARSSPVLGWGMGNFQPVFALTNEMHDTRDRFLHPESDWLWMLTETGYLAVGLMATIALLLARWCRLPDALKAEVRRGERRMHTAAAIGAGLALAHSLVNPVLHSLPFMLCISVLGGMAIQPVHWLNSLRLPSVMPFRLAGVVCMVCGVLWISAETGSTLVFGDTASVAQLAAAQDALDRKDAAAALAASDKAAIASPLKWDCYFERASTMLESGLPPAEASADFAIARFLEPSLPLIPYSEGEVWLVHQPSLAISAWREAIRRQPALYRAQFFGQMLSLAHAYPELRPALRSLANEPQMLVQYMSWATVQDDRIQALNDLLEQYPNLEQLQPKERRYVFRVWYETGDRVKLMEGLKSQLQWMKDGWELAATYYADNGDAKAAYDLAMEMLPLPLKAVASSDASLQQLETEFAGNPADIRRGLTLFRAQMDNGKYREALATLTKVNTGTSVPKYLDYEFAKVHAKLGDYIRAWQSVRAFLEKNPPA
ncbi:MAG: O-antigen ligase family protein [Verrucomicrobiaceae bacterium]|nr:O-antigen ligase family protein [Verrucomicrobiaceae bacterium]